MMKPTLVVMAAGMGSRFGGLKQMTPVDLQGDSILHFSLYDALHSGFGKVVFIIKKSIEQDFRGLFRPGGAAEAVGDGARRALRQGRDPRSLRGDQRR